MKVLRFSVGFGKPLARWVSKRTGVEWTIAALPLGGYVKMFDEREIDPESGTRISAEDLPRAFNRQNVGKRIAIVAAGPIANFLLAIALFSAVFAGGVTEPAAIVSQPAADTAAARAGFEGGETILSMRDASGGETHAIRSWSDLCWKLLDAAFDHRRIVLMAKTREGTFDFPVSVAGITDGDADQDFMDKLGFAPGGGTLTVEGVEAGSAAQKSGLKAGDRLRAIDGRPVDDATTFIDYVKAHGAKPVTLAIERNGTRQSVQIVPDIKRDASTGKAIGRIGAALANQLPTVNVRYGPLESVRLGVHRTWDISIYSLRMFGRVIVGEASLKNLSGPVTIADYAGKIARLGLTAFVSFLALVSISLGVLNLLPIPVLDGGHLLYCLVEAVTGKAVSDRWQLVLQRAGLVCIVALSMIALFNDLARLIDPL
ncbi:Membrane-associated zinc metalloprotease [Candidatus Paraburkholderia kirkii UZHbot1]|uniref:Zinc metalloprotease n=1 Tax=Candidatus Paraburkholderia kirkii UZHbot1 TaxID=1055526 RepID=G4M9E0_9BURK|nr:Membrane-associated zinc metalloprotease [Candidatus Paraburkholderia kirkii UZHbot1]